MKQYLMKDKKLMVVARSFAGRRQKIFELQKEIFKEVKVYCKLGESRPEVVFNYNNVDQSVREYQPDIIHIYIDSAKIAIKVLKTGFPCILDMYDCCKMRGQRDDYLKEIYQYHSNPPKIFSSELQAEYIQQNYGLDDYLFIPNVPLKKWLPETRKEKIKGNNIVYYGGIINQVNESFYYRYYYEIFKIFIEHRIAVHIYPSQVSRDLSRYINLGCIIHKTVPMQDLFAELSQYQVGFAGYYGDGAPNCIPVDYAKKCLPNKAFDYMFAGIPTLAYNLGYGEKFVKNWGICIDLPELLIPAYKMVMDIDKDIDYSKWQNKYCLERYKKKLIGVYERALGN